MKPIILFALSTLSCSGCSFFIAQSGTDVAQFTTRDDVRKEFGTPKTSSIEDDKEFDDFEYHGKIANQVRASGYQQALAMTLGLGEFITFPAEVYETGRDLIAGQEVRFYYDKNGRTWECKVNGENPYQNDPYGERRGEDVKTAEEVKLAEEVRSP